MRRKWAYHTPIIDGELVSTLPMEVEVSKQSPTTCVEEYALTLRWDEHQAKETDGEVGVIFTLPCVDVQYMWHPESRARRVLDADWRLNIHAMLTASAPVAMLFNGAGQNTYAIAIDEVRKVTSVECGEEDGRDCIVAKVTLGMRQFEGRNHTLLRIRVDRRPLPYHEVLAAVRCWWEQVLSLSPLPVPYAARLPMYSSWYNFHQEITAEELVQECALAKELGMEAIIVDDGWQTSDNGGGYGHTGNWAPCPEKFPDMRAFVDQVHRLGMKVMLWYSVPFMGYFSKPWERFKNMILYREDRNNTGILDPRYPEVRRYLVGVFTRAMRDYGLDGFKLDFIDRFHKPEKDMIRSGMDYICVQDAACRLLQDIVEGLRAINPEVLIEFRQRYVGPCMRQYGNMFRVADCPGDITTNRVGIVDLRMLSGDRAVHSDMITWNDQETPEDAALQILNTLFGVTQVSKRLKELRPDHRKILAFWLNYQRENLQVLQCSGLRPSEPQAMYPVITACDDKEEIIGVYGNDRVIAPDWSKQRTQLINATWQPYLVLRVEENCQHRFMVYDCMGSKVENGLIQRTAGLQEIVIPRSGLAVLERV